MSLRHAAVLLPLLFGGTANAQSPLNTCPTGYAIGSQVVNTGQTCTLIPVPAQKSWLYPTTGNAASGFTATIPDGITAVAINAPGLLINGTITLPINPADGQPITINCPKGITALTLATSPGQSVSNNFLPSACGVNTPIRVKYYAINSTWYPN